MAVQERKQQERKQKETEERPSGGSSQPSTQVTEAGKKLKADMDKLMEEIDDVLHENAEEFVSSYVQRGGE